MVSIAMSSSYREMQRLGLDAAACQGGSSGEGSRVSVYSLSLSSVTASFFGSLDGL